MKVAGIQQSKERERREQRETMLTGRKTDITIIMSTIGRDFKHQTKLLSDVIQEAET